MTFVPNKPISTYRLTIKKITMEHILDKKTKEITCQNYVYIIRLYLISYQDNLHSMKSLISFDT